MTGEGNKKLSKRDPQSNLDIYRERGFLPEGLVNYLALLGWSIAEDRDIFSPGGDGRGLRRHPGERQPGPLRPEEGRGDQRHPPARAAGRRSSSTRVVPYLAGGRPGQPSRRRRSRTAVLRRDRAAGPGADDRALRRGRPARASCSSTTSRSTRPPRTSSWPARTRSRSWTPRRPRCASCADWSTRGDRGGAEGGAGRGPRPQAAAGLRAGPGGGQRPHRLPAAVRVDRAARPRAHPGPARRRPRAGRVAAAG